MSQGPSLWHRDACVVSILVNCFVMWVSRLCLITSSCQSTANPTLYAILAPEVHRPLYRAHLHLSLILGQVLRSDSPSGVAVFVKDEQCMIVTGSTRCKCMKRRMQAADPRPPGSEYTWRVRDRGLSLLLNGNQRAQRKMYQFGHSKQ